MRVIIRADGNREIAMGHIMRCLSIGDALREEKAEVVFVTAGAETEELIRNRGYENYVLHTSFRHMEEELSAFWQYVQKFPCSLILTDSYFVTVPYMKEIKKWAKTAYIDDMGKPVYPVDILINYNVYGDTLPYHIWYSQENLPLPKLLLGGNYAPLRREFHDREGDRARAGKPSEKTDKTGDEKFEKAEFKRKAEVRNVLITTGGGDPFQVSEGLCRRLLEEKQRGLHREIRYHIVCGPFFVGKEELRETIGGCSDFIVHENVKKMWELMAKCDIAVSAAGGTMYELCCMRLPTVCFYFAENQRQMAQWFQGMTEIESAGDVRENREEVLKKIVERLGELERDGTLRTRIREQMRMITDGRGAWRIGTALRDAVTEADRAEASAGR